MILTVQENEDGLFVELPQEILDSIGLKVGDSVTWDIDEDGNIRLFKTPMSLVLVETISTFRMRYVIEVPSANPEYALDTVTMNSGELKEFSQHPLPENITSHRVIGEREYLRMFDVDNDYLSKWSGEQKLSLVNRD